MKANFPACLDEVLRHEGGYVNHSSVLVAGAPSTTTLWCRHDPRLRILLAIHNELLRSGRIALLRGFEAWAAVMAEIERQVETDAY